MQARRGDGFELTRVGIDHLEALGVDVRSARSRKRGFALACLDWTERRFHLGGALGAELCDRLFDLGWIRRVGSGRAAAATVDGARSLRSAMGINVPDDAMAPGGVTAL